MFNTVPPLFGGSVPLFLLSSKEEIREPLGNPRFNTMPVLVLSRELLSNMVENLGPSLFPTLISIFNNNGLEKPSE